MCLPGKNVNKYLLFCMLTVSCAVNNNTLEITSSNFTDEIETQQNLVFAFNHDLVTNDQTGKWDSVEYIKFSPPVKGLFKWNHARELVFSPASGFQPSTDYTAGFTDAILLRSAVQYDLDKVRSVSFHTTYLKLMETQAYWVPSEKNHERIGIHLNLTFNCRIDPNEINRLLKIDINSKQVSFEIKNTSVGNEISIFADDIDRNNSEHAAIEIKLSPGLRCLDSEYKTSSEQNYSQTLPSPERLNITQAQGGFDGNSAYIEVTTNQAVEPGLISGMIKINPAVPFTIEQTESGFFIRGNFTAGDSYELKISRAIKGRLGGDMKNDFLSLVPFGQLEPSIGFASSKGLYLSSKGSKTLGINIVNIPKFKLTVTRIYENNIQAYLRNNRYNEWMDERDGYAYAYDDYNLDPIGDVVMKQDYETKNLARVNGVSLLNLDFSNQSQFKGIYVVKVQSHDDQWRKAVKLISVSDIGLIAKQTDDEIFVFANSIITMDPVPGAAVSLTSSNNQTLLSGITNKDGVVVFRNIKTRFPGFRVSMITARSGGDFNYMAFSDSRVENSRFEVGGQRKNESGFQAFIYGDREIYRPGETIYNNSIIRNEKLEPVRDIPVKIKYLMPDGHELQVIRKVLNNQGACESRLEIPISAVSGTYTLEVYTSNDLLIGSKNISIEEFIPDRINVVLNTDKNIYLLNDSIQAEFTAVNLFGPPAANRNYEAEFTLSKKYFYSKSFPGYNFNIRNTEKQSFPSKIKQGQTNAEGKGREMFSLDHAYKDEGILAGRIFVTVFDESGRPVNRVKNFDIQTQQVFYGIKVNDYYVSTRDQLQIGCVATNAEGNAVALTEARLQVIKIKWHTIMERTYDTHYRYVSQKEEEVVVDKMLSIKTGGTIIPFVPNESGEYLVRLRRPGSDKYVESGFYAYRWGNTSNSSFEVNNDGEVEIVSDRESYKPGDVAKLLFKTPFSGKLLVTIEREKVFEYFFIKTDKKSAMLNIPIKDDFLPNVYISATLFKPLDDGSLPLTVAHGYVNLQIEKSANKLPVEIIAVEKSGSNTRQSVTVKTLARSDIEVTVAVVDEGIMQLKNSPSPDPYNYFYQKQALSVSSYDVYPFLLPDLKMKRSIPGGDGYDLQKRINPLSNKRVKLVAWWSGIMKTNSEGRATCSIDIPQFSGDLRIMAVAYKDKSFGHAEKHIKVADPVIISSAIPRFLSPGDTLLMPVTITNTLNRESPVIVKISLTGPIILTGTNDQRVEIPAGSEKRLIWKIVAQKMIGQGSVEVRVQSNGSAYTEKTEITVRPVASLQKMNDAGYIAGGTARVLDLANQFIPKSTDGKLVFSRSPMVQFIDQLAYLLDYPHGCVEQTTSIAFPQLYYTDLVKSIKNKPGHPVHVSGNVQAAISKLQSMQLYNGALSYWPGGAEESWWGSIYACHFLLESKKAGYEVKQATIDKILLYLGMKVKSRAEEKYIFYDSRDQVNSRTFADKNIFYSLYVLALSGKPDLATMNYYRFKNSSIALDSKYLLATTFLLTGDRKSYADLLPLAFEGEKAVREDAGSFSSYIRDESLALSGLLETDRGNPQIPVMVNHLSKQLKNEKYLSTQERAFAFLALGKFMNINKQNNVTASIHVDGNIPIEFNGEDLVISKNISGKKISVSAKGNGNLYYAWELEGLTGDGSYTQEDRYLQIRKSFYTRFGQPVKGNSFQQNDLVVVKLTLSNTERSDIRNIVITDMLPAGFEIENPRIGAVPELSWIKDNTPTDYMDLRDDRINLFTSAGNTTKNFYYLVRAVSTGRFNMGPVSADAMYNGEYHSYHGAGIVEINAK